MRSSSKPAKLALENQDTQKWGLGFDMMKIAQICLRLGLYNTQGGSLPLRFFFFEAAPPLPQLTLVESVF